MYHQHKAVQLPDGRWAHVYGAQDVNAGKRVPGTPSYASAEEAVAAMRMHATQGEPGPQLPDTPYDKYLLDTDPDPYQYGRQRAGMLPMDAMHAIVGPLEHKEAAREVVGQNPMMAAPMAAGIPAYTGAKYVDKKFGENGLIGNPLLYLLYSLAKATGAIPSPRSPASVDEVFAGYEGLFSGLGDARKKRKPEVDKR